MACESSSYESVFTDHSIEEYLTIPSFSSTELLTAEQMLSEEELVEVEETLSEDLQTAKEMTTSLNVNNKGLSTEEKQCRICFCLESESGDEKPQWITPCKCDGSMKWVHQKCFEQWIDFATVNQKQMCVFCGYTYQKSMYIKSISKWTLPPFHVLLQFGCDILSTINVFSLPLNVLRGKRSIFWLIIIFAFWKWDTYPRIKNGRIIKDILETTIFKPIIISLNEK